MPTQVMRDRAGARLVTFSCAPPSCMLWKVSMTSLPAGGGSRRRFLNWWIAMRRRVVGREVAGDAELHLRGGRRGERRQQGESGCGCPDHVDPQEVSLNYDARYAGWQSMRAVELRRHCATGDEKLSKPGANCAGRRGRCRYHVLLPLSGHRRDILLGLSRSRLTPSCHRTRLVLVGIRRQLKLKSRPSVDARRCPNPTAVVFDDRLADGKTHSHPPGFGREQRLEKLIEVGWINSGPGILDRHMHRIGLAQAEFMRSSRGCAECMASMAFMTKFKMTCCNWTSLPVTVGS